MVKYVCVSDFTLEKIVDDARRKLTVLYNLCILLGFSKAGVTLNLQSIKYVEEF